mgnify:CR=1 FL=1
MEPPKSNVNYLEEKINGQLMAINGDIKVISGN